MCGRALQLMKSSSGGWGLLHSSLPQGTEQSLPVMLVGNKMDLRPGLPKTAEVHTAQGQQLAMVSSHASDTGAAGIWQRPH